MLSAAVPFFRSNVMKMSCLRCQVWKLSGVLLRLAVAVFAGAPCCDGQQTVAKKPEIPIPPKIDATQVHQPTLRPDRIVLTWCEDPTTTQSVTWRTSPTIEQGFAEIAIADAGPKLEQSARRIDASGTTLSTNLNTARFHSATFRELQPSTKYAYRVGDGANWSEWFQFTTASRDPEPFSFIYFGDAQNDVRSLWSRVIREAYGDAPAARFMIHAGDLINSAENDADWGEWFGAGGWMNAMVPSMPAVGNHEMAKVDDTTRRVSRHWRPQFTLPENGPPGFEETCYTFVYQGTRILVLNSNLEPEKQAEWLDQTLKSNREKWVICVFHHPLFSTGRDRDNAALRSVWKPILDRHRVDLVLQGHDHTYGRTGLQTPVATVNLNTGLNASDFFSGTVYVVSVSGPKMYGLQRHTFMSRHAEDTQLYQIIHVAGDTLSFEAFTASGELYDAFRLDKQPGSINKLTEEVPDTPERLRLPIAESPKTAAEALKPAP